MDSTLVACRSIGDILLWRNDQSKALLIGKHLLHFTPMEYRLLLCLLNGNIVDDATLVSTLFRSDQLDKLLLKNLEKHIENAKSKLRPTGVYIRRIHRYGYLLVREQSIIAAS